MKKSTALIIVGSCLVIGGGALGYAPLMDYRQAKHVGQVLTVPFSTAASAAVPQVSPPVQAISGKPVRIEISALGIDLPIADGRYNAQDHTWTLSKDKAHYALNTPPANNSAGNTFVYGHNRTGVFKTLNRIKSGDTAILTTENGYRFTYKFRAAYETNPGDDSLFDYQGAPILTVQTCSGLWYQNRQLFTFNFENVQ